MATGLFLGRRASVLAALGCTAGIVPHLLASALVQFGKPGAQVQQLRQVRSRVKTAT